MIETPVQTQARWHRIVRRVCAELERFDKPERIWATTLLKEVAALQTRMHRRFLAAGGSEHCRLCHGQCCDCGHNHFTLVNLLGFLLQGQKPPEPDFDRPCPFLGEAGCRLDAARRPYGCVSFFCDKVENRMNPSDRKAFYDEELRLRGIYERFDRRYALSSPRGILIRAARLADEPFLAPVR